MSVPIYNFIGFCEAFADLFGVDLGGKDPEKLVTSMHLDLDKDGCYLTVKYIVGTSRAGYEAKDLAKRYYVVKVEEGFSEDGVRVT